MSCQPTFGSADPAGGKRLSRGYWASGTATWIAAPGEQLDRSRFVVVSEHHPTLTGTPITRLGDQITPGDPGAQSLIERLAPWILRSEGGCPVRGTSSTEAAGLDETSLPSALGERLPSRLGFGRRDCPTFGCPAFLGLDGGGSPTFGCPGARLSFHPSPTPVGRGYQGRYAPGGPIRDPPGGVYRTRPGCPWRVSGTPWEVYRGTCTGGTGSGGRSPISTAARLCRVEGHGHGMEHRDGRARRVSCGGPLV